MKSLKRGLKALLITALAYLIQVCVLRHLPVAGVTGSVIFAALAVLTVSCGKKYAFCSSCLTGMVMECMLSPVPALYAIAYPVIAMLGAQMFADMSDRQLERRRMLNENRRSRLAETGAKERWWSRFFLQYREGNLPAHLRIPLCAAVMDLMLNVVMCVYMYLIGQDIGFLHIARIFASVAYTSALAVVIMVPLRFFLGMYPKRRKVDKGGEYQ
ncbi:MAG: hypothetical protein IKP32_10520 [Clostridia bacterium]|nr:hypothetical protein [Clostridia bacterium]